MTEFSLFSNMFLCLISGCHNWSDIIQFHEWECFHWVSSHFRLFFISIVQILVSVKEMEMSRWLKPEQSLELSYKSKITFGALLWQVIQILI